MRLVQIASAVSVVMALFLSTAALAANQQLKADAASVDQACASETATAQCGSAQVGSGLLKCFAAYRKANPSFKLSPPCSAAVKQLHSDRKQPTEPPG